MATRLCPNAITCPGTDFPVSNYTAEGPQDAPQFYSLVFPRRWDAMGCTSLQTSSVSQADADELALADMATNCPPPPAPPAPPAPPSAPLPPPPIIIYKIGPFPIPITISPEPGQPPPSFYNARRNCQVLCPDGTTVTSFTFPAGLIKASSPAIADNAAYNEACSAAAQECITCGKQLPPHIPPPHWFCNTPQDCTVTCPDGTPFTYTVPAGLFCQPTQAQADALAQAYACDQAAKHIICIGDLPMQCCAYSNCSFDVPVMSNDLPVTYTIVGGELPPGLNIAASSDGFSITGTSSAPDWYSFTVRATNPNGDFMDKDYNIDILGFTTDAVDAGYVGVAYSFKFGVGGWIDGPGGGRYTVLMASGTLLPPGLYLDPDGTMHGVPTEAGTFDFQLEVIDYTSGLICKKSFTMLVKPINWNNFSWGPLVVYFDTNASSANSFNGPSFSASATCSSYCVADACFGGGYDALRVGSMLYSSGSPVVGHLDLSSSCDPPPGFGETGVVHVTIWNNRDLVLDWTGIGTLSTIFNMSAGVNQQVTVTVEWTVNSTWCTWSGGHCMKGIPRSLQLSGTLSSV